jgi:hypothetical protein
MEDAKVKDLVKSIVDTCKIKPTNFGLDLNRDETTDMFHRKYIMEYYNSSEAGGVHREEDLTVDDFEEIIMELVIQLVSKEA